MGGFWQKGRNGSCHAAAPMISPTAKHSVPARPDLSIQLVSDHYKNVLCSDSQRGVRYFEGFEGLLLSYYGSTDSQTESNLFTFYVSSFSSQFGSKIIQDKS